ncbi:MAG: esterase/lipase family protein [Pseudomonadota bacterium]|jgi:pimeloyl-ACP methyl ester carboxylesterase
MSDTNAITPHIVLVHGLGRSKYDMVLLGKRLKRRFPNSSIHAFDYHSRRLTIEQAAGELGRFIEAAAGTEPVSLVGHSLGGLVSRALDLREGSCATPLRRLVTLGTPHQGAKIASVLARYSAARWAFGPILGEIGALSLSPTPRQLEIGCIIGATSTRLGFNPIFWEDNDGLVLSREAELAGCAGCVTLPAFHAFMPFSSRIARLTGNFLERGKF